MLVNREVILFKIETTPGQDAIPAAATDAVLVESPSWSHEGARRIERNTIKATLGKTQSIFGGTLKTVTFSCEIKGSGTAGTAPEMGQLLRVCALDETVMALTSVTYAPVSTGHEYGTLYYYSDGLLHKLLGCQGTLAMNLETGAAGKIEFTITGHDGGVTDTTLVSPAYDTTVPPPVINVPFTIGSYSAAIAALSIDLGNTVSFPPDVRAADGYGQIIITARDVAGSFDPEQVLLATNDYISGWIADSTLALATGVIGSAAGNRYALNAPACYYREIGPGDREGLRTFEIGCGFSESSGDDEISMVFT